MIVKRSGISATKVLPTFVASLVSGWKSKIASLLCSFRLIRLFFIVAVTKKVQCLFVFGGS